MTLHEFLNVAKVLNSIDRPELREAQVPTFDDDRIWKAFRQNPIGVLIRADDETADAIWGVVERRISR